MKKSQLLRLLEEVPDDCEMLVEFPSAESGAGGQSTGTMSIHSVVVEHTADNKVSVLLRL